MDFLKTVCFIICACAFVGAAHRGRQDWIPWSLSYGQLWALCCGGWELNPSLSSQRVVSECSKTLSHFVRPILCTMYQQNTPIFSFPGELFGGFSTKVKYCLLIPNAV